MKLSLPCKICVCFKLLTLVLVNMNYWLTESVGENTFYNIILVDKRYWLMRLFSLISNVCCFAPIEEISRLNFLLNGCLSCTWACWAEICILSMQKDGFVAHEIVPFSYRTHLIIRFSSQAG